MFSVRRLLIFALLFASPAWATIAYVSASGTSCAQSTASTGVACTPPSATTAGNTVIVGLTWRTTTSKLKNLVGSASGSFFVTYATNVNGTGTVSLIGICLNCAALTTITPTFSATTKYVLNVAEYSGVVGFGQAKIASATSTSPGITFTTGDSNNVIVVAAGSAGSSSPTSNTGTLRQANNVGATGITGGLIENTVASPGSVTASETIASGIWSASGIELRTAYPAHTYIWPDCDTTHPCVIYHYVRPVFALESAGLGPLIKIWVRPSLANNLLVLTITHPSTISSIVDAGANTWASGPSAAGSFATTDVRYVCGAAANSGGEIDITLGAAVAVGDEIQISYDEISGIATSACSDGTSNATAVAAGAMQPGSITTTVDGDGIYTFGIDGTGNATNTFPSGKEQPDDVSADLWDSMYENFMATWSVQTTHGAINPTLNVAAMAIGQQDSWQLAAQAFKPSSGAGTQPPTARALVVGDIVSWTNSSTTNAMMAAPTTGNFLAFDTTHSQNDINFTTIKDNQGTSYNANTVIDATTDPQTEYACLGSNATTRDRSVIFTNSGTSRPIQFYNISGAKASSGTGCVGNKAQDKLGAQGSSNNANVVTSAFSTPFSFTPTINSSTYSVILTLVGFGAGPPSGPCNSGGVTPPTCTGDMTPFIFGSQWGTGMGDASHLTTGDVYGWYWTNLTSAISFDFLMANSVDQPGGHTSAVVSNVEVLGEPAAAGSMIDSSNGGITF